MKAGAFSLALLLVPFGPLALKLRKKISVLGDPLSLRSMEIENFKRRCLRPLFEEIAKYVEIAYFKVSVGTFKQS